MSYQNSFDFYSIVKTDLGEKLIPKIKISPDNLSERSDWMENNLSKFLTANLNQENYNFVIQKATILSKMKNIKYRDDARNGYKGFVKRGEHNNYIRSYDNFLNVLDLNKPNPDIASLPKYSFFIQFKFKLRKPFYSHDDEVLYIIDNPVTKEHVFKLPMMRPSGWKGNLRSTFLKIDSLPVEYDTNPLIKKLFGYTDESRKSQKKGRLIFYPTYFDKIGLEIINPHDRKTKAGTKPILYEVVPEGSNGIFSILYIPFDLIGSDDEKRKNEAISDLRKISTVVNEMMTVYGFGAKTSSGFGVIENKVENCVVKINGIEFPNSKIEKLNMIMEGL